MARDRDPLGKRALFSTSGLPRSVGEATDAAPKRKRSRGAFDVEVHCSTCDKTTTMAAPEFMLQHFPVWAWAPWRKDAHLMRCPACGQLAWHTVSRA